MSVNLPSSGPLYICAGVGTSRSSLVETEAKISLLPYLDFRKAFDSVPHHAETVKESTRIWFTRQLIKVDWELPNGKETKSCH